MSALHKFLLAIAVLCAYVYVNDPGHVLTVEASASTQGITVKGETYSPGPTAKFNPNVQLDTSQIDVQATGPCTSDRDCVTRFPHIIPTQDTIRAYHDVWGDTPHFPTEGDCTMVDWLAQDDEGQPFVPVDLDSNGKINCNSDYELGA